MNYSKLDSNTESLESNRGERRRKTQSNKTQNMSPISDMLICTVLYPNNTKSNNNVQFWQTTIEVGKRALSSCRWSELNF
jgi:hypothetical protein